MIALVLSGFLAPRSVQGHADLMLQIDDLTQQIQKSPANAELYLRRGELRRAHLEWDLAAADYDKAHALAPALDAVVLARGRLYFDSGWPLSAKACLDLYLSRVPNNAMALVTRAHILTRLQPPGGGAGLHAGHCIVTGARTGVVYRAGPSVQWRRARLLCRGAQGIDEACSGSDRWSHCSCSRSTSN
jgi:tetratricopeptide (TPR) repeat protein